MFSKKKSLAKIAQLRSKTQNQSSSGSGSPNQHEVTPFPMESPGIEKRLSLQGDDLLPVPIQRQNSTSTPNLNVNNTHLRKASMPHRSRPPRLPSRNHSLKYSKGSLHDAESPLPFDHDYEASFHSPPMSPVNRPMRYHAINHLDRNTLSTDSSPVGSPISQSPPVPILEIIPDRANVATAPMKLVRKSPSFRLPRWKHEEYNDDPSSSDEKNPDFYDESVYCTPPNSGRQGYLTPTRTRSSSVSKSRSMISLGGQISDPSHDYQSLVKNHVTCARDRSYLVGSVGLNSLLGSHELQNCFPDRILTLFVGTWNMNGQAPPRRLADFLLPKNLTSVPDILVIATQESFPERFEWESRLQDTLGPSHVLFQSNYLGMLHQAIFMRRDLIWHCSLPESDSYNARPGTQIRTKGAIATGFLLFGTSFLFVNSHLTAHQENTKDRIKDYQKITAMLNLPKELPTRGPKYKEISDKYDCVFWSGDLNFRLEQTRDVVIREVRDGLSVLDFDQLNFLRREGLIFKGFQESEIYFYPTYKYDVGTNKFDTSNKRRTPSYTDRILFKHQSNTPVTPVHYESVQDVFTSDHKPVWGIWKVQLRPGRDTIPLGGGLFNREVYVEGLKRRAEALQPVLGSKNKCVIQ